MRFLTFGVLIVVFQTAYSQVSNPVQFKEELHDFGIVDEDKGAVMHEFLFTNASSRPITILGVKPSCGCTTPDWTKDPVMPGKTGFVQAKFDPKGRPGFFAKTLTVTTDGSEPIVLQIKGNVSTGGVGQPTGFSSSMGNWKLHSHSLNFGKIFRKDEYVVREIEYQNAGDKPIKYMGRVNSPAHLRITVEPSEVAPGEIGKVYIGYNGAQKDAYGFQSDNILLYTDDELQPRKSFTVYATLEDDFSDASTMKMATAPRLALAASTIDFGSITKEKETVKTTILTNTGRSPLTLKSVQGNCSCLSLHTEKNVLKPGENTVLTIRFNPGSRTGTHQKAVTIYSDDPKRPVQRITLTSYVE